MQREMHAKQNTFGCSVFFFPTPPFFCVISDPPAVIVIAEVILQDICGRKSLIWGFDSFLLKCLVSPLIL